MLSRVLSTEAGRGGKGSVANTSSLPYQDQHAKKIFSELDELLSLDSSYLLSKQSSGFNFFTERTVKS